ncbi:F-box protein At5g03100 [Lactuca sativa]|uniref:F-box protein At5g03100 n=1 Tax=Lactuca sativa TaxID=4236 RepID=UPI000CB99588|nr:F-box protein At5g03100 [Lactuca sativa]
MEKQLRSGPGLEDIPDLFHCIQMQLPIKEAARTSVLSKSWLHAWSTIPTLRFREAYLSVVSKEPETELFKLVDRTLVRYLRDNIPVKSIDVIIDIENQESASFAENWIRPMAIRSCLRELSLAIRYSNASLTLPDEILSGENLIKMSVSSSMIDSVLMASHPVIKCLSLRELNLQDVHISEQVLNDILSTCSLLVKVQLFSCTGFKTIKVKNLHCLRELGIVSEYVLAMSTVLEINDVPNIRSFTFISKPLPFDLDSLVSVTELSLGHMIVDDAFVNIIQSKFPFLESLTLDLDFWKLECFNFTCVTMKKLSIVLDQFIKPVNIKVYAPNLISFHFRGFTMPSLLFQATILEEMDLDLFLMRPLIIDESFFLKMREALTFSRKCNIQIQITKFDDIIPSDINVDDLTRRVPFPAINVTQLTFRTFRQDKGLGDQRLPFFDALFTICHPKQVVAVVDSNSKHNYFS